MELGKEMLFLSDADIVACGVSLAEIHAAVEAMFAAKTAGLTAMRPKLSINIPDGQQFQAKAGVMRDPPFTALKWVCPTPGNAGKGLMAYRPLIVLNDSESGLPLAFMDGVWITGVRTGAVSAVAARHLARPESRTVGFLACGLQARSHLAALRVAFPVERVVAYDLREAAARVFAERARGLGLEAEVVTEPRAALEGVDILVSTVPHMYGEPPFLDGDWLSAGSFVALPDLGHCFHGESLDALDKMVTDDVEQSGPDGPEDINYPFPFHGEIGDLVAGAKPGREAPGERNGVVFSGIGLGDAAVGALIYRQALAQGRGQVLKL